MEASTSTTILEHSLPHEQFSSRIAFGDRKRLNSIPSKKSMRLPPITRAESVPKSLEQCENTSINTSADDDGEIYEGIDPIVRVKTLERNLVFVKEHCQFLLKCLHNEIDELKRKNKELQFQLIAGNVTNNPQITISKSQPILKFPIPKKSIPPEMMEHINKLENEMRRLRYALGETLKLNTKQRNEIIKLKKGSKDNGPSHGDEKSTMNSPPIDDLCDSLKDIYHNAMIKKQSAFLPRIKDSH